MHMILNQLHAPAKNRLSPHLDLLRHIAARMGTLSADGQKTRIVKAKAHTGVRGNEMADRLANEARGLPSGRVGG